MWFCFVDLLSYVLSKRDIDISWLTMLVMTGYSTPFESMLNRYHYVVKFLMCHVKCRDLRIGNFYSNLESNRRLRFEFESNLESNRRIVVYSFNVKFLLIAIERRCADLSKILRF